jgi:hypothetical protein
MNRLKKIALLPVRRISIRMRLTRLYYWCEEGLYPLRAVVIMPRFYYRWLFRLCVWMVDFRKFRRLADKAIHTIPFTIRFDLAL